MRQISEPWLVNELIQDTYQKNEFSAFFCGIQATDGSSSVTGSAVAADAENAERFAYFELLERISVMKNKDRLSHVTAKFKKSISNGVAAHTDRHLAYRSALLELIERDLILKSWHGFIEPKRKSAISSKFTETHKDNYIFERYTLNYLNDSEFTSTVAVGWPLNSSMPTILGFGCARNELDSIAKAHQEMLQRFVFLKDEPVPQAKPAFETSALFHQEYFLYPAHIINLQNWLNGKHFQRDRELAKPNSFKFEFHTLEDNENYLVVQADHPEVWPLYFGFYDYPGATAQWGPHPIA